MGMTLVDIGLHHFLQLWYTLSQMLRVSMYFSHWGWWLSSSVGSISLFIQGQLLFQEPIHLIHCLKCPFPEDMHSVKLHFLSSLTWHTSPKEETEISILEVFIHLFSFCVQRTSSVIVWKGWCTELKYSCANLSSYPSNMPTIVCWNGARPFDHSQRTTYQDKGASSISPKLFCRRHGNFKPVTWPANF